MSPAIKQAFQEMQANALRQWRQWAAELAAGGDPPPAIEILEAGAVLEIPSAMQALEDDATALREAGRLRERAQVVKDQLDRPLREAGGAQAVRDRLDELRAEVRRLENLVGGHHFAGWSAVLSQVREIERKHPRVFPEPAPAATAKTKPTTTRRRSTK